MICNKCGNQNAQNAKFCGKCGENLMKPQPQDSQEEIEQLEDNIKTEALGESSNINNISTTIVKNNLVMAQIEKPANKKGKARKVALIAIIFIALILAGVGIYLLLTSGSQNEKNKINSFFDPNKPIRVVAENGMYKYIDQNGKYIIDKSYIYGTEFINNYAIVTTEAKNDDITININQIIDHKGKVIKETPGAIEYYEDLDVWIIDSHLYDKTLKKLNPDGTLVELADDDSKYFEWINSEKNIGGIMNAKGKITYTYHFQNEENYISVEPSETTLPETYCRVSVEGEKYAIVNCDNGTIVHNFTTQYIDVEDDNIFEILNADTYERTEILYIQNNKVVYKSSNKDIDLSYDDYNYITIRDASKDYSERYSYIPFDTLIETSERPESEDRDDLDEWEELTKNKKFSCSAGYGIMNEQKITLPCEWDYIDYLDLNVYKYLLTQNKNYIIGEKENKTYIIDLDKKTPVTKLNTTSIYKDDESLFIYYYDNDTGDIKVHNLLTNKELTTSDDYSVYLYSNYVKVKDYSTSTTKYYNNDAKLIYTEKIED